jgi:cytochrome P450
MLEAAQSTPFYPPCVRPAKRPLRFPFNLTKMLGNPLEVIPEQAYRDPLVIVPGPPRMAFFTGTELVKTLLLTRPADFPKGSWEIEAVKPIIGNAIFSAEGHNWRWQRGAAAPLFRDEELAHYAPIMNASAQATIAKWAAGPAGAVHPLHDDMAGAAFHVISNTMLAGGAPRMLRAILKGHQDYYRGANWWLIYLLLGLPHWFPRPGGRAMRAQEKRLRAVVADLVQARRANAAGGDDLLARLLRACDPETGKSMPDELLVGNILSFLGAGFVTTAFSLTWTLYLISRNPEWENRMLREIEQVVGFAPIAATHVKHLQVVQQVIQESLRLYPTAPVIVRDIRKDMEIAGVSIPAGTIGIIPIYAIHRHRAYWSDPDQFDPNRFAPGGPGPGRFQFMPFGAGPRICIGAAFAMLEATIMIASFVRAAHFEVVRDFQPQPSGRMHLLSKNGMPMRVTLRDRVAD